MYSLPAFGQLSTLDSLLKMRCQGQWQGQCQEDVVSAQAETELPVTSDSNNNADNTDNNNNDYFCYQIKIFN